MIVDVDEQGRRFRYKLSLEDGETSDGNRAFRLGGKPGVRLAAREYEMMLPPSFKGLHPDAHAAAIFYTVRPFVSKSLTLPFGVSEPFAKAYHELFGVELTEIDACLKPRVRLAGSKVALRFSGGLDSVAAAMILPRDAAVLLLDRIPFEQADSPDVLIDMVHQRAILEALADEGWETHIIRDGHERLLTPYPSWHSEMSLLLGLYMADSLDLSIIEGGDVLDIFAFQGYHGGGLDEWSFDQGIKMLLRDWSDLGGIDTKSVPIQAKLFFGLYAVGLRIGASSWGLSEVATVKIVHQSPYRGKTASCYYSGENSFCMKCDKCFKKLLLHYVFDDLEESEDLFEAFLGYRHLAGIFERPYFDWHHVWYYLFQKIKCRHPIAAELQRQAQQGPDLSFLERWYPKSRPGIPESYRSEVESNIARYVETMSERDISALETLSVPPFQPPVR